MNDLGLVAISLHQRAAPLEARERLLALAQAQIGQDSRGGPDRVLLATCHRVELYVALATADAREWAARELALDARDPLWGSIATRRGVDAAEHLFRVAAGLDSAVAGEPQIVGQIRMALEEAHGSIDPLLRRLFERALHIARSVRRGTSLGAVRRSVGSLAVDEVVRRLDDPARATVLVVGAGEMGKLSVRALGHRVGAVVVANRDLARAEAVAAQIGARAAPLDALPTELARADALVAAADTRGLLLTRALLEPRAAARPLPVIDIAVPRSVADDARDLPGLVYRTVDDLADEGSEVLPEELAAVAERCAQEARQFARDWSERAAGESIRAVRERAEELRRAHLERALRRLGHLGERDRGVVDALSVSLTNALLHDTTIALKQKRPR